MGQSSFKQIFYPESKFGGFTDFDRRVTFYGRVNALLEPSFVVLDVGCGRGEVVDDQVRYRRNLAILKGKVQKVVGIDVDPDSKDNPTIDEFYLIADERWPIEDESVDLIVCESVVEHLEHPDLIFKEFKRVLKKGGYLCLRTPNAWHYIALFSRFVPNEYHSRVLKIAQEGRKEEDVFPTYYRCNSISKIREQMVKNSFEENAVYGFEPDPGYLSFSIMAYYLGVLYQKFAPKFFKATIFAFGKKK